MGAGCSSETATATGTAPTAERTKSGLPVKDEQPKGSEPQPAFQIAARPEGDSTEGEVTIVQEHRDQKARLEALQRCFEALDKDRSGSIDLRELKQYLFKTGVNVSHITGKAEELMRKMDLNEDQMVSMEEFLHMMEALLIDKSDEDLDVWVAEVVFTATSRNVVGFGDSLGEVLSNLDFTPEQVEVIKRLFKTLDRDGSRFVELHEVKLLFGKAGLDMETASEEVISIMAKLDKNGDRQVSEQEFFITMSAVRKCKGSDQQFMDLLDNVLVVAQAPEKATQKPALTEVLLAEDL